MFLKKYLSVALFFYIVCFSISALSATRSSLDTLARNLSYREGQSVSDIVKNLTKDLTEDKDKAYVLAAFIAYQFQRNGFMERELEKASSQNKPVQKLQTGNFLKTRIGTSQDFASLYQQLCTAAGLESVLITGYAGRNIQAQEHAIPASVQVLRNSMKQLINAKDYHMQQYEASWNAVRLNNKWALVDTYWMIGGTSTTAKEVATYREMEKYLRRREQQGLRTTELTRDKNIDTSYFNANPRQFIKTHFPLDNQWQLLNPPVSWRSFIR